MGPPMAVGPRSINRRVYNLSNKPPPPHNPTAGLSKSEISNASSNLVKHRQSLVVSEEDPDSVAYAQMLDEVILFVRKQVPFYPHVFLAALYGTQVFMSFFLVLIFMTYNAYLVLGASIGHFVFGAAMHVDAILAGGNLGKWMACH